MQDFRWAAGCIQRNGETSYSTNDIKWCCSLRQSAIARTAYLTPFSAESLMPNLERPASLKRVVGLSLAHKRRCSANVFNQRMAPTSIAPTTHISQPFRPPSGRLQYASVSPHHETHNPSLRKVIYPEPDVDEQVVEREVSIKKPSGQLASQCNASASKGLYPLLHRGRIPPESDVTISIVDERRHEDVGAPTIVIPSSRHTRKDIGKTSGVSDLKREVDK